MWVRTSLRLGRVAGEAGVVALLLAGLLWADLPAWLEGLLWALVVLAIVGVIGQLVMSATRRPTPPPPSPTVLSRESLEIGDVGDRWIQVVKVLRDHLVIDAPRDLAREDFPATVAVDPGEVEEIIRRLATFGVTARRADPGPSSPPGPPDQVTRAAPP